ncbi:5206_t:CDS:2 [Cetraspora pellucida]|uniref:5206_t:CDS:1 n=1 Tax=Cetraspora pellucida TaxID=1433469 RepID=A0ACA9JYS7_9GLOM|nr:5206_t:CDS:2 [Cetraspora pellucida]
MPISCDHEKDFTQPSENEFKSSRRDINIEDVRIEIYPNWEISE